MLYFVSDLLLAVSEITTVSTTIRRHFVKHALTLLHNAQWSLQNRIFLYLTWNVEVWIACRNIPHMPKILIFVLFKFISTNLHTQLYNLYAITWSYAHTYIYTKIFNMITSFIALFFRSEGSQFFIFTKLHKKFYILISFYLSE